jgi:hypothetical protein|tara:strand:+ start:413 stop:679 length:267 start_codon:yes stop_codon:yes gene_type:complete
MYILTVDEKGVYSVQNEEGNQVLYIFEEEDDATRYAMMLEEEGSPEMSINEVEDEAMIAVCESQGYEYTIITKNDIVVPPVATNHDFI